MAQLRQDYQSLIQREAEVVVIGLETMKAFQGYWAKESFPFVGLPDPVHAVLDLYGQEVHLLKLGRMPAQFVIDRQGTIRLAHYGSSMKDIVTSGRIIELLDRINSGN